MDQTVVPTVTLVFLVAIVVGSIMYLVQSKVNKQSDKTVRVVKERMYNMVAKELGVEPNEVHIAYRGNSEFTVKTNDKEYIFLFEDKFTRVDKVIEL